MTAVRQSGRKVLMVSCPLKSHRIGAALLFAWTLRFINPVEAQPTPASPVRMSFEKNMTPKSGELVVSIDVSADGSVTDVRIEKSSGDPKMDEAAKRIAKDWKFIPGTSNGVPIAATVYRKVSFTPRSTARLSDTDLRSDIRRVWNAFQVHRSINTQLLESCADSESDVEMAKIVLEAELRDLQERAGWLKTFYETHFPAQDVLEKSLDIDLPSLSAAYAEKIELTKLKNAAKEEKTVRCKVIANEFLDGMKTFDRFDYGAYQALIGIKWERVNASPTPTRFSDFF